MELTPGTIFAGDYRIVRPLSAGGMGAVYVVEQLSTGKQRALKLMHRELVYDPASRQHFEQEARIGARIQSDHVVEVQAAGVDPTTQLPYLVMELLEGEDMATRLQRGPLSLVEATAIFEQLCHALGAAHDAGVVHRDLKPENIFLAHSKRSGMSLMVKVLDFGIAKITEGQTRTTAAFGTPLWLAPEQTERGVITPAADVWAMGLIAFAMLTGHVFWRAGEGPEASVTQLIREIVFDPIPPASSRAAERRTTLPPGFDVWFARCVARDPRARFPNARTAYQALVPVLRGGAPVAVLPSGVSIMQSDGQYLPTADAMPAVPMMSPNRAISGTEPTVGVATRPSAGHSAPIVAPRVHVPTQVGPPPPILITPAPISSSGPVPAPPKSGSLGYVVAAIVGLALLIGGGFAVFDYVVRPALEASKLKTASAQADAAPVPMASVATTTTLPTTPPATSVPTMPTDVPDLGALFDGGLGIVMPKGPGLHVGGVVQSSDTTLQEDAENKLNTVLAAKFDQCLADHPPTKENGGGLAIMTHVGADGSVTRAQTMGVIAGPLVLCFRDVVKGTRFAAPKRATELTFSLFWTKT